MGRHTPRTPSIPHNRENGKVSRGVKKTCRWHVFSPDLGGYAAVASIWICTHNLNSLPQSRLRSTAPSQRGPRYGSPYPPNYKKEPRPQSRDTAQAGGILESFRVLWYTIYPCLVHRSFCRFSAHSGKVRRNAQNLFHFCELYINLL